MPPFVKHYLPLIMIFMNYTMFLQKKNDIGCMIEKIAFT